MERLHIRAWKFVAAIICAYFGVSTLYNLAIPIGEAPDEPSHIQYVELLLKTGQLPTIPVNSARYSYEAEQPPLYYLLEAGWIRLFWPDNKLAPDLQSNPDFSFAKETPYNAYLQNYPSTYTLPVHLLRLFSTLIGVLTLLLVWLSAREIWPVDEGNNTKQNAASFTGVVAVGFAAFLPGFTFTSGTVNNDTLAAAAGAAVLYIALRIAKRGLNMRAAGIAGIVMGLAMLSKWSLVVFVPLVLLTCIFAVGRRWAYKVAAIALFLGGTILFGGWPFLSNFIEYGDPLATSARMLAKNEIASPLANMPFFWIDRGYIGGMLDSLWGVFGLRNLQLPSLFYLPYYLLLAVGLLAAIFLLRRAGKIDRHAIVLCLIAIIFIYAGVAYQNTQFWAIQGRLLLPGLTGLALMVGLGMDMLFSSGTRAPRHQNIGTGVLVLVLFVLNIYALVGWLIPAYYAT